MLQSACVRACFLFVFASLNIWAQNTSRVSGSVVDSTGSPVPGVTVNLFIPGGSSPVLSTATGVDGLFRFTGVQPVSYDLSVEAKGFRKEVIRGIKVDAGLELAVKPIKLEVSAVAETIEVTAEVAGVQTANAEIAATVTNAQLQKLPSLNRSPLAFISLQAGVGGNGRTNTTINGLRPSFANVTIDGINIQDNFIRTNNLDFQPNMLLLDQVAEFTIATSNTNAANGNGAAQVSFVTPSGTNQYHGGLYWYNRNNIASANTWFNNRNGVRRPFLNQNQVGGKFGGKIIKDKLFFYVNYEALRLRQQSAATRTVLRPEARQGIFRYFDTTGATRSVNLFSLPGITPDATARQILGQIPGAEVINRDDIGDRLNTGGYGFNIRNNRTRDNVTGKVDYILNTKNSFSFTYLWNRDIIDRPDLANDFVAVPKATNSNKIPAYSGTWRWNPTATFTNEVRAGANIAPAVFATSENFGNRIITLPLVSNPVNTFRAQGRYTDTYNYANNSSWFKGKHTLQFGFQGQLIKIYSYGDGGNLPQYNLGMSAAQADRLGFSAALFPGLRAQDFGAAQALAALHAGLISSTSQTFNVTSRTSGFVGGATNGRNFRQMNSALYINDQWKIKPRLTLTLGARWEYYTPVDETNSLALLPKLINNNPITTLLSNATLDFAGNAAGRPWYGKDWNNVGPNVGLAWQPFNDSGKTVIRAGYSINFPNDEFIRTLDNNVATNAGLSQGVANNNLVASLAAAPPIATPAFTVPRTFQQNNALDPAAAFAMPDPNLRTPYVQQFSFGIQREFRKGVLEVRYVGNRATKQFRGFDYNQIQIRENGFLADFQRAYQNGILARSATGAFNPSYNPAIAGSSPLPFFDRLPSGGLLTNPTISNLIFTQQPGSLGDTYTQNRLQGNVSFFRNPFALGTNMITNYSNANYNALQVDYTKRFSNGLQWQANYTYSKVMSDTAGDTQQRFEPFLDNDNPQIERARTPFDLTHSFKFNGFYELPVGRGKKFDVSNPVLNRIVGGWGVGAFMTWQSGAPFSVNSGRGTLNRGGRSGNNTAVTTLNKSQLDQLLVFRQTGNGPYFVNASAIGTDGRAVGPDGAAPFNGQAFTNPIGGSIGTLQRRMFSGPRFWNTDLTIQKDTIIREGHSIEFRAELFNMTNTPSFFIGDQDINSIQFGRITSTASGRRIIQFGLYYRF